ncbi:MAG: amidohydrolase family protein [Caldilineaceae bacterium]|nr:amidohydrolase family protein [Caldilineaceae bacterium]
MIIDTHTHFYDPTRPEGVPWPPPDNQLLYRTVLPEHFHALAAPHGVTMTVVVEANARPTENQWILALAAADPSLVGYVGRVEPNRPAFAAELTALAKNPCLCGIRCGGSYFTDIAAGSFLTDMATLAEQQLTLDVLVREEHFGELIALAQRLPTLQIVIDHIAHMPIDGNAISPTWVAHYGALAAQPNIAMKVSALMEQSKIQPAPTELAFYRPTLDALWAAFGPERVLYGSNWPVVERAGSYGAAFQIVHQYFTEKGEAAYAAYFRQNAQRIYRLAQQEQ